MLLLIDGYNLLKAPMPPGLAGLDELSLCRALARSGWSHGGATVVFDGAFKPGLLAASPVAEVELVYAGKGRSADEVIFGLIEQHTYPARLVVVSSDHEIQRMARRRRARAVDSDRFASELLESLRQAGRASQGEVREKSIGLLDDGSSAKWAKLFGVDPSAPLVHKPSGTVKRK